MGPRKIGHLVGGESQTQMGPLPVNSICTHVQNLVKPYIAPRSYLHAPQEDALAHKHIAQFPLPRNVNVGVGSGFGPIHIRAGVVLLLEATRACDHNTATYKINLEPECLTHTTHPAHSQDKRNIMCIDMPTHIMFWASSDCD